MGTHATHRSAPVVIRKARADTHELSVTAVLSFPGVDQVGDIVHADGLDFTSHRRNPWVDLEHNGQCVGWARKSLSATGGKYGLEHLNLSHGGETHRLPVGTTWFDPNDALQSQVFALVAEDALPGVSLEFRPVPKQYKALGRSPLEQRPAYEFFQGDVVRWTHCASPVNEGATVAKSMGTPNATDKLLSALSAKRVGSEPMHPTIFKALSQLTPQRRLVRVEKAMEPNAETETVYDDAPAAEETEPTGGGSPTAMAAYNLAQGIKDLCEQARTELSKGEHVKGRKSVNKILDAVEDYVEDALSAGKMVDADLAGDKGDEDVEAEEPEVPEEDTETDDDGIVKGIPMTVRKALKRFALKDIKKARERDDAEVAAAIAERDRAAKEYRRAERNAGRRA